MGGVSPMEAVLVAPGVKDRKVVKMKRDDAVKKEKDDDSISSVIRSIIGSTSRRGQRNAFHVMDLSKIVELYGAWCQALGDVRPYYAVKCNAEPALLGTLAALGAGFDCASRAEMEAVLALGVHPRNIVYANPCKPEAHIQYAAEVGVNLTTYDSEEEVAKLRRCHPTCELLLRIKGPDGGEAKIDLGTKYGALGEEVVPLLRAAQRAGLHVAGVSFHVGSGAPRMEVYRGAIEASRVVFDAADALGMTPMRVLDIGGGFMAGSAFDDVAAVINDAIAQHFGDLSGRVLEVIGEPGRYFTATAFTLAARIFGKRTRGNLREYWIEDGVYGSLACILVDIYVPRPRPLMMMTLCPGSGEAMYTSTVFGPTCDSIDTVVTGHKLPEMSVGDWLLFDHIGAYSTAVGSKFNGFDTSDINIYLAYNSS